MGRSSPPSYDSMTYFYFCGDQQTVAATCPSLSLGIVRQSLRIQLAPGGST